MSPEWAEAVKNAWNAGPNEEQRAEKLDKFWDWIDNAKNYVNCTIGLQVTDRPGANTVLLRLEHGSAPAVELADAAAAVDALYILGGTTAQWQEVMGGLHVGKVIMYRKLLLLQGQVLDFFKSVYFWTESIATFNAFRQPFDAERIDA